jgi:antagonist of KipI
VTLRIASAGLQTTVQDLGRPTHQRDAVPAGGAMDRLACRAANLLVGNDEGAAVLEATLLGPTVVFEGDALIAITGGDLEASIDGLEIPRWHAVAVRAGARLRFGRAVRGCRAYIAVAGGIEAPLVFGSRSTYLRGGFGGIDGRALRSDDVLHPGTSSELSNRLDASLRGEPSAVVASWSLGITLRPRYSPDAVVRVIDGAHASLLDNASRSALYDQSFRVSSSSDRMGYRLEGPALALRRPTELMSEGVAFGTMQLPPGGAPIVLMADRQTTGGYPRIAEVASVDLPIVAQLRPGDQARFRRISLAESQRLYLAQEQELAQARAAIALRFSGGTKK